ncbi:Anthranilate phosphoribosyltransferase [Gracilariopsis chorda]|uniref:anthranilate phosphoribosyltransferase n=1 Tax=Gracilariopsis chorda TaxID=448386 RepID=A0A2V3J0J9_9FLOR|nr:Anthranilate phosphoribosyltransferase [Gracilariopsis chorda]|eukprot:PXF47921.1 Anthranilate phosphoribosyltransferase [Gracilariopsis chorda]
MKPYLDKLVSLKNLTLDESTHAVTYAVSGNAHDAEIAAFLALLAAKGETSEEVFGVAKALREQMVPVVSPHPVLDIVGTGGDGFSTVNISSAASVVAAAAGCKVGKHGNRSVSSKSGSADVLEALGVNINLSPEGVAECIDQVGIGFMYAPSHHPTLRFVGPVRKAMKIRTLFNIMGPLLNPCDAKYAVIGVYSPSLLDIMADVLISSGVKHAVVVHTAGMDEYSNTGVSEVVEIIDGVKERKSFDPEAELDMARVNVSTLKGGDANENAGIIRKVLAGELSGPITDAILLNAAAGCYVYGLDPSIREGLNRVRGGIASGKALETLEKWVTVSQGL